MFPLANTGFWQSNFDTDAIAFLNANGTTGSRQKIALNRLVLDLKGGAKSTTTNKSNLWIKIYAAYPYTPINDSTSTLDAYKYNLLDPRDLDDAFRITWVNSPTSSTTGVIGGTGKYGNTHFNVLTEIGINTFGIAVYLRSQNTNGESDAGALKSSSLFDGCMITPYFNISGIGRNLNQVGTLITGISASTDRTKLNGAQHDGTTITKYTNGVIQTTTSVIGTAQNLDIYTLCRNLGGSANLYSNKEQSFLIITDVLTADEIQDLNDAINKYNNNVISGGR